MEINKHDLTHSYFILVPLSKEACEDLYDHNICLLNGADNDLAEVYEENGMSSRFSWFEFREDTYDCVEKMLFWAFNDEFDIFINWCEEEIIENQHLDKAIEITQNVIKTTNDDFLKGFAEKLLEMFRTAKKHNTIVGFYF